MWGREVEKYSVISFHAIKYFCWESFCATLYLLLYPVAPSFNNACNDQQLEAMGWRILDDLHHHSSLQTLALLQEERRYGFCTLRIEDPTNKVRHIRLRRSIGGAE